MYIAVDFDGTIVTHKYPDIGQDIGAFPWLKKFRDAGARLILWTMRNDSKESGPVLSDAVRFCLDQGIEFFGINHNPSQLSWTDSPKAYAHIYIDDMAFGCPLVTPVTGRAYVDWSVVGPAVLRLLTGAPND